MNLVHIIWWENDEGAWDFESIHFDRDAAVAECDLLEQEEESPWIEYHITTLEVK